MKHLLVSAFLAASVVGSVLPVPVYAQSSQSAAALQDARGLLKQIGMYDLLPIIREEGINYAAEMETDMFPGSGGGAWISAVERIYDINRMDAVVTERFAEAIEDADIAPLIAFFESDLGKEIVSLEISARRAMLDPSVENMSNEMVDIMRRDEEARLGVLGGFIEANQLLETNIVGALNSNLAFYKGLKEGGAFEADISEEQMLTDVWEQEPDIRESTTEWIFAYLALAYQPLSDADIEVYTSLSKTPAGSEFNRALFAAFDTLFVDISWDLGVAAAQFMAGEDI